MDLDRCPRCGKPWTGGEICRVCKFVPIGAGLQKGAKVPRKKARKYVEPGSARGFLTFCFLCVTGYAAYALQPWNDDWEMIRALFGQGRHHSLVGEWQIVKTIAVQPDRAWASRDNLDKGVFRFSEKGVIKVDLIHGDADTEASGRFVQDGIVVSMRDVKTEEGAQALVPRTMTMKLAWTGNDEVIALDKSQAIYLHRRKHDNPLLTFMQMGLAKPRHRKGGDESEEMRGEIADVKREGSADEVPGDQSGDTGNS